LEAAAWGVIQIANAAMERAIRKISVERGHDPRDFTLVAFGGAGPLHACELAERLGLPRVFVPRAPGVLSALGMLLADLIKDYSQSVLRRLETLTEAEVPALFGPLNARARAEMQADGVTAPRLDYSADLRYVGQSFEINVPLPEPRPERLTALARDFHARHAQRYGHAHPDAPIELVNIRVRAVGPTSKPVFEELAEGGPDASAALIGESPVWFDDPGGPKSYTARLYERERFLAGNQIAGPAILVQLDATTVVPPGWVGTVDNHGHLWLSSPQIGYVLKS
jgi:N-methylhydantoinase A